MSYCAFCLEPVVYPDISHLRDGKVSHLKCYQVRKKIRSCKISNYFIDSKNAEQDRAKYCRLNCQYVCLIEGVSVMEMTKLEKIQELSREVYNSPEPTEDNPERGQEFLKGVEHGLELAIDTLNDDKAFPIVK